jgi:predicted DNA-binding protein (MmcQ/YjbR family)
MAAVRERVARLCTSLPEVESSGDQHVGFTVRGRRFAWFLDDHHGDGRLALNCKGPPGESTRLAEEHPERFFIPAYLGSRGWIGLWLDGGAVDWDEVERIVVDAYRLVAPGRLRAQLDQGVTSRSRSPGSRGSP